MPIHVVKQGDCISSVAQKHGFFWQTIWEHENNAALRDRRQNPNVLLPNDEVFVPDKRPKDEPSETTLVHVFRLKGVPARLNIRLIDPYGKPRVGLAYTLTVDGKGTSGTTPDDAMISFVVPPDADSALLTVTNEEGKKEEYPIRLAHLNPVEDTSGLQARLKSLGYYKRNISEQIDDQTRDALKRFQQDVGLPVTGEADAATTAALLEQHGS
jgi:hypothetical protein